MGKGFEQIMHQRRRTTSEMVYLRHAILVTTRKASISQRYSSALVQNGDYQEH